MEGFGVRFGGEGKRVLEVLLLDNEEVSEVPVSNLEVIQSNRRLQRIPALCPPYLHVAFPSTLTPLQQVRGRIRSHMLRAILSSNRNIQFYEYMKGVIKFADLVIKIQLLKFKLPVSF